MSVVVSLKRREGLFRLSLESPLFFGEAGNVAPLVECWPGVHKALVSIGNTL